MSLLNKIFKNKIYVTNHSLAVAEIKSVPCCFLPYKQNPLISKSFYSKLHWGFRKGQPDKEDKEESDDIPAHS